jgi:SIR2-like domain
MIVAWEEPDLYRRRPAAIIPDLATGLKAGALCLMVGSGISHKLKLPLWHELVCKCCDAAPGGIDKTGIDANTTGDTLLLRMQRVRKAFGDDTKYVDAVHDALYENWTNPAIASAPELMRAIGVMVMGSTRGRVKTVVNFNFDSLLEWYLSFHGYVIQVIEDVPRALVDSDLHIFHPHGYLPLDSTFGRRSGMLLFDKSEQESRIANRNDAWMDVFRYILGTQVFIAIGLSGRDPMGGLVLAAADQQRRPNDKRPAGFWFVKKGSLDEDYKANLEGRRVVVVEVPTHDDIAKTLFEIGQRAAGPVIV